MCNLSMSFISIRFCLIVTTQETIIIISTSLSFYF
nr:MAG TPA: hypothetical protein [Caudoviricetes sp.]